MPRKFDLEGAAELEIIGALAVGHGQRRRVPRNTGALSAAQVRHLFETLRGLVKVLEQARGEVRAPGGARVRLEKRAGHRALWIAGL